MKKALDNGYTAREICLMIEFIFSKEQNYLEKGKVQPTILVSKYCNTIYNDSLLWANDEYTPSAPKHQYTREWNESSEDNIKIGEWD